MAPAPHRYVIIGGGAVGSTLAAQFSEVGISTVVVARGENGRVLRERGLRYLRPDGERIVPLDVVLAPADIALAKSDILVLATKAQHSEAALIEWATQPVRDGDGGDAGEGGGEGGGAVIGTAGALLPILTFQNGLETERIALRRFRRVYGVSIWIPASYLTPGEVMSAAAPVVGATWVGRYPAGLDDITDQAVADLRKASFAAQAVTDIGRWKAGKLLGNIRNALDVLAGTPEELQHASAIIDAEARAVLAAAGLDAADARTEATEDLAGFQIRDVPGRERSKMSTWQSFARRAGSVEVDYLNGEIVLLGRLHGVPAPANEALQIELAQAADAGEGPGERKVTEVLAAVWSTAS
jgi:thiosulfate/3-mercaptopyruvate sulfurtransferase